LTPGVNFTNVSHAAFSYKCFVQNFFVLRFKVCTFLAQKYWRKSRAYNVDEIDWYDRKKFRFITFHHKLLIDKEKTKKSYVLAYIPRPQIIKTSNKNIH
jgi:hypothetical protein